MLRTILNNSWRQHPTKHQLYGHLPPISKTLQVSRARHAGHCWRSRDELISDVLLWTPTYGRAKAGRPARTYIQQLCEDTGCSPEDLPEAMNDREKWRERVRDIHASGTWWWWNGFKYSYLSLVILLIKYLIRTICPQLYGSKELTTPSKKILSNSIWSIYGKLIGSITLSLSGSEINSNEGLLHITQVPWLQIRHKCNWMSYSRH